MAGHRKSGAPTPATPNVRREFQHVGRMVQEDEELKEFARREWANPEFRAWAAKLRGTEPAEVEVEDFLKEA